MANGGETDANKIGSLVKKIINLSFYSSKRNVDTGVTKMGLISCKDPMCDFTFWEFPSEESKCVFGLHANLEP